MYTHIPANYNPYKRNILLHIPRYSVTMQKDTLLHRGILHILGKGEIDMREQTCCFTGHRELPAQELDYIIAELEKIVVALIAKGIRYFGTGGALGFDTLAAQTVLRLRQQYPHIRLILVLPCPEQARKWASNDITEYERIMAQANKVVYTAQNYSAGCMHKRNRHLVDNSSICVCYLTKDGGGTDYTVGYARLKGLEVVNLAPRRRDGQSVITLF